MIAIGCALIVLTLTIILLLLCYCFKKTQSPAPHHKNDSYDLATSNASGHASPYASVSRTHHFKAKKLNERTSKNIYSRNSSSSCSSTTATSSASSSPKTNEITLYCDDDINTHSNNSNHNHNESQKILTIDPSMSTAYMASANSQGSSSNAKSSTFAMSHTANSNQSDMLRSNLTTLTNLYNQSHYMNALSSSGSNSVCASSNAPLLNGSSSTNTTQSSSFMTHLHQQQLDMNNVNVNLNDLDFDEQDETDADFLVSTSSNLEFLKAHSLFNTTPLNYYPTLNLPIGTTSSTNTTASSSKEICFDHNLFLFDLKCLNLNVDLKMPREDPPPYSDHQTAAAIGTTPNSTNQTSLTPRGSVNGSSALSPKSTIFDYRFSTFLPPTFPKHHELI